MKRPFSSPAFTPTPSRVLSVLREHPGGATDDQVIRQCGMSLSKTQRMLQSLAEFGFVVRELDPMVGILYFVAPRTGVPAWSELPVPDPRDLGASAGLQP